MPDHTWNATVDWICIGSGAAGCGAAIAGHDQGFSTLLVEKSPWIGGVTAQSGGILWVPMNDLMTAAGIEDSREAALAYLRYTGGGQNRPDDMAAYVDNAARVLTYLHEHADIPFRRLDLAEFYYPVSPGSMPHGRLLICQPFPAETLGEWRDRVRLSPFYHSLSYALNGPNPALGGSDGPQVGHSGPIRGDETGLALWRQRPDWPELAARLDEDEAQRVAGAALAGYLFRAVVQRGIAVRTESTVERLCLEAGRVTGVVLTHGGQTEVIQARRGVVLATSSGDGWRLAVPAGAEVTSVVARQGMLRLHVPGETDFDGTPAMRGNYELRMRHGLVVNQRGERVGNEWFFQALGAALHTFDTGGEHRYTNLPCYFIFDQTLIDTYSFAGRPPGVTEGLDWVQSGDTLDELAGQLGLPSMQLEQTIARFNHHAKQGADPDFNREPSSLGPLEMPPFYGVKLVTPPVSSGVMGVVTDTHGQVIHYQTGKPIPGLYACGQIVAPDRVLGVGYQAGCQLMRALIFGFLAAEQAARC
jgi:succinate dehydrogenase/fumarate reductase flavoprotein subunit